MTRHWFALVDAPPEGATAVARARDAAGAPAGFLAIWVRRSKPLPSARRIDGRLLDPGGAAAAVSLVRPPPGVRLLFDDLAVQQARRDVLARPPFAAVTTLLSDDSHFEGALTVARGGDSDRLRDDPFARVLPAVILHVDAGLLGSVPAPAGPVIERYGSAQPWPADRFGDG